jgi:hypothetical protein
MEVICSTEVPGPSHLEVEISIAKRAGLILNGTHKLLAYADEVNLLGDNIDTINKNTKP